MKTVKNRYLPQQYTEIFMINSSLNDYSRAFPLYGRGVQRRLSLCHTEAVLPHLVLSPAVGRKYIQKWEK